MSSYSSESDSIRLDVDYPETSSRGLALLGVIFFIKGLLLIPHFIILYFLGIALTIVVYIGYWAVLFTGRNPEGLFRFTVGVTRWQTRANGWFFGWTDKYPPFSLS